MNRLRPLEAQEYDLRDVTRPGVTTTISLSDWGHTVPWIKCGQIELTSDSNRDFTTLNIRGPTGWTDFEHDTIKVVSVDLIGLKFRGMWANATLLQGWFLQDPEAFRFPTDEYLTRLRTPKNHSKCKSCKPSHMMVEEGLYVPKSNSEMFERVRGYKVDIIVTVGTVGAEDE